MEKFRLHWKNLLPLQELDERLQMSSGNIYHDPSIVVDTHVKRISKRLGFTKEDDPVKVEYDLMKVLPKDHWILYNIQIITFGRNICFARGPKCSECFLQDLCKAEDKRK